MRLPSHLHCDSNTWIGVWYICRFFFPNNPQLLLTYIRQSPSCLHSFQIFSLCLNHFVFFFPKRYILKLFLQKEYQLVVRKTNAGSLNFIKVLVAQSCPTLCDPMACSPPGPWNSLARNSGVGCYSLLQGIFRK